MKIAIIGKGLAGLGACYHLQKLKCELTVFSDKKGASWAASGLMHAYVGDTGEKSFCGDEGFLESCKIFDELSSDFYEKTSFIRNILSGQMRAAFKQAAKDDLEFLDETKVLIKNGVKVDVPKYLASLEAMLIKKGVQFISKKIQSIDELKGFDLVILASGCGIKDLSKLKMKYLKGQSLVFENLHLHAKPFIAKGYLVPFKTHVIIGSTYEKKFDHELADIYTAYRFLEEPLEKFFSPYDKQTPLYALSGVRVAHPNVNYPQIIEIEKGVIAITGLGSRGLLYHSLIGKELSRFLQNKTYSSHFFKML